MLFKRTESGLVAKFLFFDEPLVWVEGPEDIPFYKKILNNIPCRIEPANGKEECEKLSRALIAKSLPFVVVIDGDYEILKSKRSKHRRIVKLHRYSMENYLFEKEPLENLCRNYCKIGHQEKIVGNKYDRLIEHLESELTDMVILDMAHTYENTKYKVLPNKVEPLLKSRQNLTLESDRIKKICESRCDKIEKVKIKEAKSLVFNLS